MSDSILAAIQRDNPNLNEALKVVKEALSLTLERLATYGSKVNDEHRNALQAVTCGLVMQMYGVTASDWEPFKDYPDYGMFQITTAFTAGRRVYPMPCGTGKSQSIISVICAVLRLESQGELSYRPSLVIASYQIEANIKLLRQVEAELTSMGLEVPDDLLAVSHSKPFDEGQAAKFLASGCLDYSQLKGKKTLALSATKKPITKHYDLASLPATPIEELTGCRFIFISHNRIKSPHQRSEFIEHYYTYQGDERSLLIWDEVMLPARHWYISSRALAVAMGEMRTLTLQKKMNSNRLAVQAYVKEVWGKYTASLNRLTVERPAVNFTMPEMTIDLEKAFNVWTKNLSDESRLRLSLVDGLKDLASLSVRLTIATDSGVDTATAIAAMKKPNPDEQGFNHIGLMTASEQVPRGLNNIAILDASHPVSRLLEKDSSIKTECYFKDELEPGKLRSSFKTYENLTIHHHNATSSESKVRDLFTSETDRNNQAKHLRHAIPPLVESFADDDAVLIVTFKDQPGMTSILKTIRKDLRESEIDIDAKLPGTAHKRINFLTWGMHTSMSELSFCTKLIIVGVLHKPSTAMYCEWIAQAGDDKWLTVGVDGSSPAELVSGEVTSDLYQLINRCNCRNTINGSAGVTDVYLQYAANDNLKTVARGLSLLMPKLSAVNWKFEDTSRFVSKQDQLSVKVADYLRDLPEKVKKISSTKTKKALGIGTDDDSMKLFTRAIDNLPDSCPWVREARSLVYNPDQRERLNAEAWNRNQLDYFPDSVDGFTISD